MSAGASLPASLTLYSDWYFCSACGLPSTCNNDKKKLATCRRCKTVAYHNADCQKNHWKCGHKRDCAMLAKAIDPLMDIVDCWEEDRSKKISWWDMDSVDPQGAADCHRIWKLSEMRWNHRGEYLEAMTGFQRALEPVTRLWNKREKVVNQSNEKKTKQEDSEEAALSKLSLHETNSNSNGVKTLAGISLAQKLLFCAYCEADGNQIQSSRMRLSQCIAILLECAKYNNNNKSIYTKITALLKDAWMELMLSYEEETNEALRAISRHVVHMAIQSSYNNTLYRCEWRSPLQRPGYMASLEDRVKPYIPVEEHPSWCQVLEKHWNEIADELFSLQHHASWTPVGCGDRGSGGDDHRVVNAGGKWTEHVLFGTGASCQAPFTQNLLRRHVPDAVSLAEAGGGEVIFSKLEPNTRIAAHCGPTNIRWTAHLGLVIPTSGDCKIRVANEWHHWERGKILLFDDSYEHEIRNDTNETRVVLLLRLWHPSLPKNRRRDELNRALEQKEEAVQKRYHAPTV